MNSRSVWSTWEVSEQQGIHSEALPQKKKKGKEEKNMEIESHV